MSITVIKLGGSVLVDNDLRRRLIEQIAALVSAGHRLILAHGGGKQIAALLDRLRIDSHFHDGLRVTDEAARDVVQMVLAGLVGKNLVAELLGVGVNAVSLAGGDGESFLAEKLLAPDGTDLGYVGRIVEVRPALVVQLLAGNFTPVVACLALGREDRCYYNINGDQMASAVAGGVGAETMIMVTDVGGVRDDNGRQIANLTPTSINSLLDSDVARGGMRPKLRACLEALSQGVATIRIVGAAEPNVLWRVLREGEALGTTIHHD